MIPMKWVEHIATLVCKIMKSSLQLCEFILPMDYFPSLLETIQRGRLHYGPPSCPMSYGIFPWSYLQENTLLKVFRPLTRCKPNVDQEQ